MTGRKLIADTYGGRIYHGGGAFSGKDPTKVDRSGAYMARYVAKNCVAAGLADELALTLVYVIGRSDPITIEVEAFGTAHIPEAEIRRIVKSCFNFTPRGMIEHLGLRRPIYLATACYGHFGREEFPWERCDMVSELRQAAGV
jgi:S-adenosylmethionine synthetase